MKGCSISSNFFASMDRLRAQAKRNLETNDYRIRKWWVDKYKRPSSDPLFLNRSWPEWQVEMFEDMLIQRENILEQISNGDVDSKEGKAVLDSLNKIWGDDAEAAMDPLIDKWERELAAGKMPDLDEVADD